MKKEKSETSHLSKTRLYIKYALAFVILLVVIGFFKQNQNGDTLLRETYTTLSTYIGSELVFLLVIILVSIGFYFRIKDTISNLKDLEEQDKQRAEKASEKSTGFTLPPGITTILIGVFLIFFSSDISLYVLEDLLHTPIKQTELEPLLETSLIVSLFENPFIQVKTMTLFVGCVALLGGGALFIRNIQNTKSL